MNKQHEQNEEAPISGRKTRDRAALLPLIGLILLIPPVANVFQLDVRLAGIPFTALYLFAVWAVLIGGAAALSKKLRSDESGADPDPMQETED